ncbi:MAG: hypothetical protein HQL66_10710 [Magnetococcales bacterium]|nr:hypothetical protein [Magnetococcales bacterium]
MLKKFVMFAVVALFAGAASANDVKCGANAANPDAECGPGTVCILAMTPPVCKPTLAVGQPCVRDKVCQSNKCEKAAGAKPTDKGVCK